MNEKASDEIMVQKYINMTDDELVHNVCRKERLTLYNFMKMHLCDDKITKGSEIEMNLSDKI